MATREKPRTEATEMARWIEDTIKQHAAESPKNRLEHFGGGPIFDEPLVGFADGDDSIFQDFKRIIGDFHFTPREALEFHLKNSPGQPEADLANVSVIAYILPIAKETRLSNRKMKEGPSPQWNHTRWFGEMYSDELRQHLVSLLQGRGYAAVAPLNSGFFRQVSLPNGPASTWSERHAAYAAGLGTFSLTDAMITAKGMAMRVGSVVVNVELPATPRKYANHAAYCPYLQDGSCGACIPRCPADAISAAGHDKLKCQEYTQVDLKPYLEGAYGPGYIGKYAGCGLCQTKVPCESRIPARVKAR